MLSGGCFLLLSVMLHMLTKQVRRRVEEQVRFALSSPVVEARSGM